MYNGFPPSPLSSIRTQPQIEAQETSTKARIYVGEEEKGERPPPPPVPTDTVRLSRRRPWASSSSSSPLGLLLRLRPTHDPIFSRNNFFATFPVAPPSPSQASSLFPSSFLPLRFIFSLGIEGRERSQARKEKKKAGKRGYSKRWSRSLWPPPQPPPGRPSASAARRPPPEEEEEGRACLK